MVAMNCQWDKACAAVNDVASYKCSIKIGYFDHYSSSKSGFRGLSETETRQGYWVPWVSGINFRAASSSPLLHWIKEGQTTSPAEPFLQYLDLSQHSSLSSLYKSITSYLCLCSPLKHKLHSAWDSAWILSTENSVALSDYPTLFHRMNEWVQWWDCWKTHTQTSIPRSALPFKYCYT